MGSDSFDYDNNGNQITRNVGGSSYTLSYDYENRMTGVSGPATATFTYDGDGNRVKGTIGGVTTVYIGNPSVPSGQGYFEWTGSTTTMNVIPRYYYASSRTNNVQVTTRVARGWRSALAAVQ
jgi:hypothetical protein